MCILDQQSAIDRGTNPVIQVQDFSAPPPLNINDEDISPNSIVPITERESITDMTTGLMSLRASFVAKHLNFFSPGDAEKEPSDMQQNWSKRWESCVDWRRGVEKTYLGHIDSNIPWHWLVTNILEAVFAQCLLMSVRPLQCHPRCTPPRTSGTLILSITTEVLEKTMAMWSDPRAEPWRWWGRMYNQWFALAVCCGELCVSTTGPIVDGKWSSQAMRGILRASPTRGKAVCGGPSRR